MNSAEAALSLTIGAGCNLVNVLVWQGRRFFSRRQRPGRAVAEPRL